MCIASVTRMMCAIPSLLEHARREAWRFRAVLREAVSSPAHRESGIRPRTPASCRAPAALRRSSVSRPPLTSSGSGAGPVHVGAVGDALERNEVGHRAPPYSGLWRIRPAVSTTIACAGGAGPARQHRFERLERMHQQPAADAGAEQVQQQPTRQWRHSVLPSRGRRRHSSRPAPYSASRQAGGSTSTLSTDSQRRDQAHGGAPRGSAAALIAWRPAGHTWSAG